MTGSVKRKKYASAVYVCTEILCVDFFFLFFTESRGFPVSNVAYRMRSWVQFKSVLFLIVGQFAHVLLCPLSCV